MKYIVLNIYLVFLRAGGVLLSFLFIGAGALLILRFPFAQFDYIPPVLIIIVIGIVVLIGLLFSVGLFAIADIFQATIDTAANTNIMVDQLNKLIRKD